ncbi:MAG: hypothetical protein AB1782_00935 [Cyanobacteriota bacterium]
MNVQNYSQASFLMPKTQGKPAKSPVAFTATLPEIQEAIDTNTNKAFCPGKKGFVTAIVKFFEGVQEKMKEKGLTTFDFKLGQKNEIPEALKGVKIDSPLKNIPLMKGAETLEEVDNVFATSEFKCKPTSTCGCGKNIFLGEYLGNGVMKDILGVKNKPDVIELDVKNV